MLVRETVGRGVAPVVPSVAAMWLATKTVGRGEGSWIRQWRD